MLKLLKYLLFLLKVNQKNTTVKSGGHVIRTTGYRESWKKAIITLSKDDSINLVEGEL